MTPQQIATSLQKKMAFQNTRKAKQNKRRPIRTARLVSLILFIVTVSVPIIIPGSSAAPADKLSRARAPLSPAPVALARMAGLSGPASDALIGTRTSRQAPLPSTPWATAVSLLSPPPPPSESISTFAGNCSDPKTDWKLGETVCAQVNDVVLNPDRVTRRIQLVNPAGFIVESRDVTASSQSETFVLPTNTTFTYFSLQFDNRGTWRVNLTDTTDATVQRSALITVHDLNENTTIADLQINKSLLESTEADANATLNSVIWVFNYGPDSAQNVRFVDVPPPNTTFVSLTQTTGPAFTCTTPAVNSTGTTTCTRTTLGKDETAGFVITYKVNGNVADGTVVSDSVSISSDTTERDSVNNSSGETASLNNPTPPACTITAENIVVGTDTVNPSGQAGAIVNFANFPAPQVSGSCGTGPVTFTPPSGSFFALGSSSVTATTPSGEFTSFFVNVVDDDAPTLSCPPPSITASETTAGAGATVNYTGLTASDNSGAAVITCFEGTDERPSGSHFDVGTHSISCTAKDAANNQSNACTFNVTVNPAPACAFTPHANISADSPANACAATVNYDAPTLDTSCATGNETVTCDRPSGSLFPIGDTLVTCTASPGGASTSFTVTVKDVTAPVPDLPTLPTITSECEATAGVPTHVGTQVVNEPPTATDNCGGKLAGSTADPRTYDEPGTYTVHWTFTDDSGNTLTQEQTVVVTSPSGGLHITGSPVVTVHNPVGSTACSIEIDDLGALLNTSVSGTCSGFDVTRTVSPAVTDNVYAVGTTYTIVSTVTDGSATSSVTQTFKIIDDTPPVITSVPPDATYQCASNVPAASPSQATATDNCVAPTITVSETNNGGTGSAASPLVITRTYTAKDESSGLTASRSQTITVVDNTPPTIALVGGDPTSHALTVECHTAFNDPGVTTGDNCDQSVSVSVTGNLNMNIPGAYTLTYTATDDAGNQASVQRAVTVVDTTPPNILFNGQTPSLWPANHKYKTFQITDFVTGVTDSCDTNLGLSGVVIWKVTSDETENGNGDGNTTNDIVIAADAKSVQVRAERNGGGNGRVYTITFSVTDASGNTTTATAKVVVPHNPGETAVDSGPNYCQGHCP